MISDSIPITEHRTIDEMGAYSLAQYQPLDSTSFQEKFVANPLSMISGNMARLLEYNFEKLISKGFGTGEKRLLQLAEFARLSRIQIKFVGLYQLQRKYPPHNCCTWFSGHKYHPECDLVQLLSAIQSQSVNSPRKYNIKLIY